MIHDIGNSSFQYPQQILTPNESATAQQDSIRKNISYSYETYEMVAVNYVNRDSSSAPSDSLDLLFFNLKEALAGVIPFENMQNAFPYKTPETPDRFAGRVLNRIQEQYLNIEVPMVSPDERAAIAADFSGAMPVQEPEKPAAVSGNIVQIETADEDLFQPVVVDEKQNFLDTVEKGIETGFQQTVSYLEQAVYREQSVQVVKEADQLIKRGLQSLRNDHSGQSRSYGKGLEMHGESESKEFHLEIMTRDGDRVNIEINAGMMSESVRYQYGDTGGKIRGKENSGSKYDSLTLSVQGELDQDELAAISDLITRISSLANMFYSGNYNDALSNAAELWLNPDELSGFTLDMTHEIQSYEAYMRPDNPSLEFGSTGYGKPAVGNYMETLFADINKLSDHQAFALFENPIDIFHDIFLKFKDRIESGSPDGTYQNPDLITGMMEKAMAREEHEGQTGTDYFRQPSDKIIDYYL